jgi:hypothetical protein
MGRVAAWIPDVGGHHELKRVNHLPDVTRSWISLELTDYTKEISAEVVLLRLIKPRHLAAAGTQQ